MFINWSVNSGDTQKNRPFEGGVLSSWQRSARDPICTIRADRVQFGQHWVQWQLIKLELYWRSQASGKSSRKDRVKLLCKVCAPPLERKPTPSACVFVSPPTTSVASSFFSPLLFLKELGTAALKHEWDI